MQRRQASSRQRRRRRSPTSRRSAAAVRGDALLEGRLTTDQAAGFASRNTFLRPAARTTGEVGDVWTDGLSGVRYLAREEGRPEAGTVRCWTWMASPRTPPPEPGERLCLACAAGRVEVVVEVVRLAPGRRTTGVVETSVETVTWNTQGRDRSRGALTADEFYHV